jgi:hypothetical protein
MLTFLKWPHLKFLYREPSAEYDWIPTVTGYELIPGEERVKLKEKGRSLARRDPLGFFVFGNYLGVLKTVYSKFGYRSFPRRNSLSLIQNYF